MNRPKSTHSRLFYLLAIIAPVAALLAYSNHFGNGFHFDDAHTIVNNVYIRDIRNIPLFFRDGTTISSLPANQSYRPVVAATLAIDYWLGKGLNPFYFHLSTFVLFLVQGLLMFLLFARALERAAPSPAGPAGPPNLWSRLCALFAVAWYLLHPACAETVNYVIARSDSLSTQFLLAALALFIYSPFCRKWGLYLIPAGIALLAKPVAGVFAPLLLTYLLIIEEQVPLTGLFSAKHSARALTALKQSLPAFGFCVLMLVFIKRMDPPTWTPGGASLYHYLITQPYVWLHYFGTFFLPIHLSADTDWTILPTALDARFFIGCAFALGLILAAAAASRKEKLRPVAFGLVWFMIALVPTSVIPLAEVMNDHRLFFPYVGLTLAVSWALALGLARVRSALHMTRGFEWAAVIVAIVMLTAYGYGSHRRNAVWRTDETLWRDVTEKSPKNARGWMNYGLALMARADYAAAEGCFTRALGLTSRYPYLLINMGVLKEATGRPAEAEDDFRRAVAFGPNYPECHYYYGRFLKNQGRIAEAVASLNRALGLASAHLAARHLLMEIYAEQGDLQKLSDLARQTITIVPGDPKTAMYLDRLSGGASLKEAKEAAQRSRTPESLIELSLRYYEAGQYRQCIEAAQEALKLRPGYDLAYNNICAAYNKMKQWDKAIEAGDMAVKLNPNNERAKNNLHWAKEQKRIEEKKTSHPRQ